MFPMSATKNIYFVIVYGRLWKPRKKWEWVIWRKIILDPNQYRFPKMLCLRFGRWILEWDRIIQTIIKKCMCSISWCLLNISSRNVDENLAEKSGNHFSY